MTIGEMCRLMLTRFEKKTTTLTEISTIACVFRLEWFDTRFPRIAVNYEVKPVKKGVERFLKHLFSQKQIRDNLEARQREQQEWENEQGFGQVQQFEVVFTLCC